MGKVDHQKAIDLLNELARDLGLFGRSPRFRYFTMPRKWKKTRYAFGWTTERQSNGKFVAFKYRILRNGNWKLVKKVEFGKRRVAKARALKWHQQYYES